MKKVWNVGFRYTSLPEWFIENRNVVSSENVPVVLPLNLWETPKQKHLRPLNLRESQTILILYKRLFLRRLRAKWGKKCIICVLDEKINFFPLTTEN